MNTTINIIAASVFGVGISAGAVLYVGTSHQAKQIVPAPVVTKAPAPVVVTNPGDDVVNIITDSGKTFTVMRKNVSCRTLRTTNFGEGITYRICEAHGVITDLAGQKTHYSSTNKYCFKKGEFTNGTNNTEINSMACSAVIKFGASKLLTSKCPL